MAYLDKLLASGEGRSAVSTSTGSSSSRTPAYAILAWIAAILLLFISGDIGNDGFVGRPRLGHRRSSSSAACCISAGRSLRWQNEEFVVTSGGSSRSRASSTSRSSTARSRRSTTRS